MTPARRDGMALHFFGDNQRPLRDGRRRVLLALLALTMLTMPVSYRGGSDVAHAHSFFHFLSDAATGSLDHHWRWMQGDTARHDGHDRPESTSLVAPAPAGTPVLQALGPASERVSAIGLVLLMLAAAIAGSRPPLLVAADRLAGRSLRPPVPPPRLVGIIS